MPPATTKSDLRTIISNLAGEYHIPDAVPDSAIQTFLNRAAQIAESDIDSAKASVLIAMWSIQAKMDVLSQRERLRYEKQNPFNIPREALRKHLAWTQNMVSDIVGGSIRYTDDLGRDVVIAPCLTEGMFLTYHSVEDGKPPRVLLMLREPPSIVDILDIPESRFRNVWGRAQTAPPELNVRFPEEDEGGTSEEFHAPFRMIKGYNILPEIVPDGIIAQWAKHPASPNHGILIESAVYWRKVLNKPPAPVDVNITTYKNIRQEMAPTVRRVEKDGRVIYRYLLGGDWFMWVWVYTELCPFSVFIKKDEDATPASIEDSKTLVRPDDFERVWQVATEISDAETLDMSVRAIAEGMTPANA